MVIKVQRLSPHSCDCVIEQWVEYDDVTNEVTNGPNFLLMNDVCDNHAHMKSTSFRAEHAQLSSNVKDLIEQTKARNMKQVDDLISKATRKKTIKELKQCREYVIKHNQDITEEWEELVSFEHAFDSHIYDQILKEQKDG